MVTLPGWTYQNRIVTSIDDMPEGTYGFIYETYHKPTGKRYIGKKVLYFERNKQQDVYINDNILGKFYRKDF